MEVFTPRDLRKLWRAQENSQGGDNGQVTIIGGSELFTGAPLLALVAASRMVDMVYLATPDSDRGAAEKTIVFSKLKSVVWVPREDMKKYIEKSDAILIGPGMMRYEREGGDLNLHGLDRAGSETRMLTQYLLAEFPGKKWVIDGGSLQVMDAQWIPKDAIITPNIKEYEMLFGEEFDVERCRQKARKYDCVVVHKGPTTYVTDGDKLYGLDGGNAGLTKGGTGDVLAGMTVGLLAKNPPLLSACAATLIEKATADMLSEEVGHNYSADDVAENVFKMMQRMVS